MDRQTDINKNYGQMLDGHRYKVETDINNGQKGCMKN